ncbi:MAG TPA: PH domain-containing protein [Thermomicrobiales bacterium]|nr:PH domain-containing protein [Thermomicrobiales bacterium]
MIYCPDCGTENDEHAAFCDKCGRRLADVAEAQAVMNPPVGLGGKDAQGRRIADDGLPAGHDMDGEPGGERVLWRGRPSKLFSPAKALTNRYKLTSERLMIDQGFIGRRTEEIDLYRVNDVAVQQHPGERVGGFGDITVETSDATAPVKILHNVADPDRVKDLIREAARVERQRRRVMLRDEV